MQHGEFDPNSVTHTFTASMLLSWEPHRGDKQKDMQAYMKRGSIVLHFCNAAGIVE